MEENIPFEEGELVNARLNLTVSDLKIINGTKSEPEVANEAERRIDNFWLFQFDSTTGNKLISPVYYTITDQEQLSNINVMLKESSSSVIYVVANTYDSTWGSGIGFDTVEELKEKALPNKSSECISVADLETRGIPMSGYKENVAVAENSNLEVPVERMFFKLKIEIGTLAEGMTLNVIDVIKIPMYSTVYRLASKDSETPATYPADPNIWGVFAFKAEDKTTEIKDGESTESKSYYILYMPENIQGIVKNEFEDPGEKTANAPTNALKLQLQIDYKDETESSSRMDYLVYPGGNTYDNYNLCRNHVYRVKININSPTQDMESPSANCFVILPNHSISFWPYNRPEKGGGFSFSDYLDPEDETGKKVIESVDILWQTKDAIGDNTNGDLVWYDKEKRKIYVKAGSEGNALIAAKNIDGEIIWSWHIWVTDINPGSTANAIRYYTYSWDNNNSGGIHYDEERMQGRPIMSCNLGALSDLKEPTLDTEEIVKTFGMQYQWGRKDPFPPFIQIGGYTYSSCDYSNTTAGIHYGNNNKEEVGKTRGEKKEINGKSPLFYSLPGKEIIKQYNLGIDILRYAIANPTVFFCGTMETSLNEGSLGYKNNYCFNGDWLPIHNDCLWGGLEPSLTGMKHYDITNGAHIFDNYGNEKTIFDPCPLGWRVPSGELWLGFTKNGVYPFKMYDINTDENKNRQTHYGMYMYLGSEWRKGKTSFFPTQGPRVGDGSGMRIGICGNYHNATTDLNQRVNILHIHNAANLFHIFETEIYMYYVKSVAGPIRCVRDVD